MNLPILFFSTLALIFDETTLNSFLNTISASFSELLKILDRIIFFRIGGPEGMPLIVIWLISGGIFFTIRMKFINIRAFKHAIDVVRGKYDDPEEPGEISHFEALATALSATVGIGNITGVAVAIALGGPGASLWMTVAGLLGMTTKFVECTLGQKYRLVKPDGTVAGGPMYYLSAGLAEIGQKQLGGVLAVIFCILCLAGNSISVAIYQSNQSKVVAASILPFLADRPWIYGLIMVVLVGLVIIGGIQRIATVASAIVPVMCGIYLLAALWIVGSNITMVPHTIASIIKGAFAPEAVAGGFIGCMVQGFRRSVFSSAVGIGEASIAHAAAKTKEPVREGIVALLEPFIDTVVICNLTAIVLIITGAYSNPEFANLNGAALTSAAFASVISWFPYILSVVLFLFAFSTMISSGYYGLLSWQYLLGEPTGIIYKILYLTTIFIGSIASSQVVVQFSDAMYLTMSLPNLLGAYFLSNIVARELEDYMKRLN